MAWKLKFFDWVIAQDISEMEQIQIKKLENYVDTVSFIQNYI